MTSIESHGLHICRALPNSARIAAILDQADALRRKRGKVIYYLESLTDAVFTDMFGHPIENQFGFETAPLGELGRIVTGSTPKSSKDGMYDGPIPFITPGDLESDQASKRTLTQAGASEVRVVRGGSTLVCCIGATIGKVGRTRIPSAFNQQINAVEWGAEMDDDYGYYTLRFFKKKFAEWGTSTTLPILKKSAFAKIRIPVSPLEEQRKFSKRIAYVAAQLSLCQQGVSRLDFLFASLQHQAFRGEL